MPKKIDPPKGRAGRPKKILNRQGQGKGRGKRHLSYDHLAFIEAYLENGGRAGDAMRQIRPDKSMATARPQASRFLGHPEVRERIQARVYEAFGVTALEVIGIIVSCARANIEDFQRDDGSIDLSLIKSRRLGHLVKRIDLKQTEQYEVTKTEEGQETQKLISTKTFGVKLEIHDQLQAATNLARILGIEDQARDAAKNAAARVKIAAFIQDWAVKRFDGDVKKATEAYLEVNPDAGRLLLLPNGNGHIV